MRRDVWVGICALAAMSLSGCQSFPPALTGVTIAPSNADGEPQDDTVYRTRQGPPIPLIALRVGAEPNENAPVLNQMNGEIAVTLARGVQNFLLLTTLQEPAPYFVVALFLDHETTPALSGVVTGDASRPVVASRAPMVMGLDGDPVPNASSVSARRAGYRVSLQRAAFPLPFAALDLVGPWRFFPDRIDDTLGIITIEIEPVGSAPSP